MPFALRPYRRFPVQCSVSYNAGPFHGRFALGVADGGGRLPSEVLVLSRGERVILQKQ